MPLGLHFPSCAFRLFHTDLSKKNLQVGTWLDQAAWSLSVDPVNLKFRDRLKFLEIATPPIRDHSVFLQIKSFYGGRK